jgi:hypothetical protein
VFWLQHPLEAVDSRGKATLWNFMQQMKMNWLSVEDVTVFLQGIVKYEKQTINPMYSGGGSRRISV